MINLRIFTPLLLLIFSGMSFAKSEERQYFLDHVVVSPGKPLTAQYTFPTVEHNLECQQDVSASHFASVEWKYNGVTYKAQAGAQRRLTLVSKDTADWMKRDREQLADNTGTLVFTNMHEYNLYVTCSYVIPEPVVYGRGLR